MQRKYKLGEQITALHRLKRQRTGRKFNWTVVMFPEPRTATVIGVRTLWNGELIGFDEDTVFCASSSKRAVLVAEDLRGSYYVLA